VNAAATGERIQVSRQGSDERFTFTRSHLCDFALVQHEAADQLYVEVTHASRADTRLANDGKSLRQKLIERFSFATLALFLVSGVTDNALHTLFELRGFCAQLVVTQRFNRRLERVDLLDHRPNRFKEALVAAAKKFSKEFIETHI
jgi:hypothetical protein